MSSVGQAVGMVIGGVIGFFAGGNVMLGASIGGAIGGYIDPPKGQDTVGPRLEDLTVQTSTYGAVLPRIKGTVAVTGNVFWLEGDKIKERKKTKKVGGKGGGGAKQTTYSYSATFAVGLSHQISAPIAGVRRLWLGNKLVYEASATSLDSTLAGLSSLGSTTGGKSWAIYAGSDDQLPDPRMQADKGAANVSGYPGRCYIVFYDLDLTEHYNNSLLGVQAKVEIVCGTIGGPTHQTLFVTPHVGHLTNNGHTSRVISACVTADETSYAISVQDSFDEFLGIEYFTSRPGEYLQKTGVVDYPITSSYGVTSAGLVRVMRNRDGALASIVSQGNYWTMMTRFFFFSGSAVTLSQYFSDAEIAYGCYDMAACDGGEAFLVSSLSAVPVVKFSGAAIAVKSSVSVKASAIALSETRVFVAHYISVAGFTTVSVFNRDTLALVASYTNSVNGNGCVAIFPVSDDEFYLASNAYLSRWVGGTATSLGAVMNDPSGSWAMRQFLVTQEPDVYVDFAPVTDGYQMVETLTVYAVAQQVAKLRDIVTEECALAGISASDLDLTELVNSDVRGYRVSTAGSVRSVLEQLQAVFPFDVIQSGYKVKFKSRGGSSVLTVPEDDLAAQTSGDMPVRFTTETEMPSQVPAKVTFNFLNPDREYDPDEQSASFTAQEVKNSYTVSLPLVMSPTEALQAADVLLKKEQHERTAAGPFWLPPSDAYRKLEAADVIDVIAQGRTHTLRLTKVTQEADGRIECTGKLTSSAAYTSTAEAQDSLAPGQTTVPLAGSSELILLDIPRMTVDQDVPGLPAGMYGYTSGWPGGVALRSDDSGESFTAVTAFDQKTEVFTVSGMPASVPPYSIDYSTVLTVTPDWSNADLYSITETQLYALGNLAAYGADGRWEIVAFKTVVDNTGSYTIRDFMRGRFGTEWAMALHADGDKLVMLDVDALDFMGLPLAAVNSPRIWRGVTSGASIDSDTDTQFTYAGVNFETYSPVDLNGNRNPSTFDWTVSCTRRSRIGVEAFSGLSTPLAETSERYEVDVWNSDYTAIKRTITGLTAPTLSYTAAQQIADWAIYPATLYVDFYQVSEVMGRGYRLRSSIYRSIKTDGSGYAAAVLELSPRLYYKLDGNTTTITDSGSAASNATASATGYTYQQPGLLTGGTGYSVTVAAPGGITSPRLAAMDGAYSVTLVCKPTSLAAQIGLYHKGNSAVGGQQGHYVYITTDGKLNVALYNGSWRYKTTTNSAISANEKAVFVFVYDGATNFKIYKNGSLFESLTLAAAVVNNTAALYITALYSGGIVNTFVGGFDEFAWFTTQLTAQNVGDLYEAS